MKISIILLCCATFFSSCEKETTLNNLEASQTDASFTETSEMPFKIPSDETLIVLSAPSVNNDYYSAVFDQIIDYLANFASLIENKDQVVILADAQTMPYLEDKVPSHQLIEANIEDIWIRDFSPVLPNKQIKFNYLPDFQSAWVSNLIDNSFEDWFYESGLQYGKKTNLILDGGNVVDNGANRVVVTDRFLWDNPQFSKKTAKAKLKKVMGVSQVAVIPEVAGDATGHADGMLMFTDANTILLHQLTGNARTKTINELKNSFPGIKIVEVADYYEDDSWQGFSSACNIFVNSVVTDKYIYMPTFNTGYDAEMLNLIKANTNKTVVPVPAEDVCFMGGSVRCLSWQVKGGNADKILNLND